MKALGLVFSGGKSKNHMRWKTGRQKEELKNSSGMRMNTGIRIFGFKLQLCSLLAIRSLESYLTSLWFSFLV